MNNINTNDYSLKSLSKINIILGKNGCGKSSLLKNIETELVRKPEYGKLKYITPERGGVLSYDPNIDGNISSDIFFLNNTRRTNQLPNFKQQSVAQFRNLELLFYREMDITPSLRNNSDYTFDIYFNKINNLLDNIQIKREKNSFKIYKKGTEEIIHENNISSGESELISLGIECLVFEKECVNDKENILFLDEPDVHLHPDLQERLSIFLYELVKGKNATVIMATHSTAILGALSEYDEVAIEFMISGQKELNFKKISEEYKRVLPIFGAHPLSNCFNQKPILLVEGEDDERIWQQAIRSSNKKLRIYPCQTDGLANMKKYEKDVSTIITCIYENARAFSLRDKDDASSTEIEDFKRVERLKLSCRAAENLLLTDDVLESLSISWNDLMLRIDKWLENNNAHQNYDAMCRFRDEGYNRKDFDLKEIRNDLMHIIGKSVAWEVAIGKKIGSDISQNKLTESKVEHTLYDYLGGKLVAVIT